MLVMTFIYFLFQLKLLFHPHPPDAAGRLEHFNFFGTRINRSIANLGVASSTLALGTPWMFPLARITLTLQM